MKNTSNRTGRGWKLLIPILALSLTLGSCSWLSSPTQGTSQSSGTVVNASDSTDGTTAATIVQVEGSTSQREKNFSLIDASTRTDQNANGATPLSTMEIAAKAQPTVVAISISGVTTTAYGPIQFEGAGSGVIVSADGYIVTNNHVVADAKTIDVVLATGKSYTATLVGTAPNNDIAVIKIDETNLPAATIGNSDDLVVGELAVAVGNPLGDFQGTVTAGIVSSLGRTLVLDENGSLVELRNLIQTDAAINNGNSGGGLFNSYGELIGINVAKASSSSSSNATVEGLGFAIPSNTAAPIINSLVNEGYVSGTPSLNISGTSISEQMAQAYQGDLVAGVWIRQIADGSCVIAAGMKVGDVITEFGGEQVTSVAELNLVKNRYKAGDEVSVKYYRSGSYYDTTVILDEQNQN